MLAVGYDAGSLGEPIAFNHAGVDGSCGVAAVTTSFSMSVPTATDAVALVGFSLKGTGITLTPGSGCAEVGSLAAGAAGDATLTTALACPATGASTSVAASWQSSADTEWAAIAVPLSP